VTPAEGTDRGRSVPFDLFAPGVIANPYPWYRLLRESSPLHRVPAREVWVLSRYADVRAALLDHQVFSSAEGIAYGRERTFDMITSDPPEHTRLRKLVNRSFTPRVIARIEERIRVIAGAMLDEAVERGTADWVRDVASPLPITVIAEMLGIAATDRADFKRWSDAILRLIGGDSGPAERASLETSRGEFLDYLRDVMAQRRRGPSGGEDLIGVLLEATGGEQLTEAEVLSFCLLLLVAGNETTTNAISNGLLALHEHPDELVRLARFPDLLGAAIEETLRYDAPIQGLFRTVRSAVALPSGELPAGARVLLLYGSANRDGGVFPDGDSFRLDREPAGSLTFGAGVHACLGVSLARMELRLLGEDVLRRRLRVLPAGQNERAQTPLTRGLTAMPVLVTR